MVEVYDLSLKKIAILENAYGVEDSFELNKVFKMNFSLPANDPKTKYCKPFFYVKFNDTFYRILPTAYDVGKYGELNFECEHVIATLIDDIMYGDFVVGNLGVYTSDVINFVLNKQTTKRWVLGVCEFSRQFEYGWSHESLLSALFSIPNQFTEPYMWEYDTTTFPWTINLRKLDTSRNPELYVRQGKNVISLKKQSDPSSICTRLYAHGYGEGVNALTFADINDGKPYIESPREYIERYGLKSRLWVDRRYENPESLLQAAKAMLTELQEPLVQYDVEFTEIDSNFFNTAKLGKIVRLIGNDIDYKTYVVGVSHKYNSNGIDCTLTIANKPTDIAESVADMADRQRIEMTYAQGATQIYSQSLQNNASNDGGLVMDFFIPDQMRIINKVLCKIRMEAFRGFVKTSSSNGGVDQTLSVNSSSQTVSTQSKSTTVNIPSKSTSTSISIGKVNVNVDNESSTRARWESTPSSASAIFSSQGHTHQIATHYHSLDFDFNIPTRSVDITIPGSSSSVTIPGQSFSITIPGHSHQIKIPSHTHEMTPGIYRFGSSQSFELYVNGVKKGDFDSTSGEIDLTHLLTDETGKIPRGRWQTVEVRPNELAYVSIALSVQGFVQSRGDATV